MIWQKLDEKVRLPKFSKVILKLQDLLEGEIFNTYIKLGKLSNYGSKFLSLAAVRLCRQGTVFAWSKFRSI